MRILALMDTRIVSGPARQLIATIAPLQTRGIQVEVVCFEDREASPSPFRTLLEARGIRYHLIHSPGRLDRALVQRVLALLKAEQPDAIQTHSYRPAFIAWLLRRLDGKLKWIGFFHGETNEDLKVRVYNLIDRYVLRSADRRVVVAPHQLNRFPKRSSPRYLPNAVLPIGDTDIDRITPPIPEALPRPWIGYVGRLSSEKGWDVLLAAMQLLVRSQTVTLVLAGGGPDEEACRNRIKELALDDHVLLLGQLSSAQGLYPLLDALVLPSRSEGMPNSILEALHANVPIVATSVGAVRELLPDDATGLVVPPDNPEQLADAIRRTLREGRTEKGRLARERSAARFSLDRRVEVLYELYTNLISSTAR